MKNRIIEKITIQRESVYFLAMKTTFDQRKILTGLISYFHPQSPIRVAWLKKWQFCFPPCIFRIIINHLRFCEREILILGKNTINLYLPHINETLEKLSSVNFYYSNCVLCDDDSLITMTIWELCLTFPGVKWFRTTLTKCQDSWVFLLITIVICRRDLIRQLSELEERFWPISPNEPLIFGLSNNQSKDNFHQLSIELPKLKALDINAM